jgi:hypothetical protein
VESSTTPATDLFARALPSDRRKNLDPRALEWVRRLLLDGESSTTTAPAARPPGEKRRP